MLSQFFHDLEAIYASFVICLPQECPACINDFVSLLYLADMLCTCFLHFITMVEPPFSLLLFFEY